MTISLISYVCICRRLVAAVSILLFNKMTLSCVFICYQVRLFLRVQQYYKFKLIIRDVHETFWAETETRPKTHVSETEMRPRRSKFCSRRDRDWDRDETLQLPRRWLRPCAKTFSVMYDETHWQWKKLYRLINSHHGKHFLFVILCYCGFLHFIWNYHWIINGFHHKELQLQCCIHEPLYVYCNLKATEISKLQLIIALYIVYIWLIVFILISYTLSSLWLGHLVMKKDWHDIILLYDK